MNLLAWLVLGGLAGWVMSVATRTYTEEGVLLNVIAGTLGAFIGGFLLAPFLGIGTTEQGDFNWGSFLLSLAGALIFLGLVRLLQQVTPRR